MRYAGTLGPYLLGLVLAASACGDDGSPAGGGEDAAIGGNIDASTTPRPDAGRAVDDEVRFIAMGDTGTGSDSQHAIGSAIATLCAEKGCDMVLLLGDNFYDSGVNSVTDPLWESYFEEPYADVPADVPFYAVLGNHDYGGQLLGVGDLGGMGNEFHKGPIEVEYTDYSDKWNMPATFYTLRFANVGFMMLDTNSIMWDDTTNGDQEAWYAAARAELNDADWVLGAGHHPYLSNGRHGNAGSYESIEVADVAVPNPIPLLNGGDVKDFFDTHVCGTIDMYFSGHDHNLQWVDEPDALCGAPMIVSGAGAKTTDLELLQNNTLYAEASKEGFVYVVVKGKDLTLQFLDADLNVNFEQTISQD